MKQLVLGIFLLIGHYSLNAQVFLFETESSNSSDMTNVQVIGLVSHRLKQMLIT